MAYRGEENPTVQSAPTRARTGPERSIAALPDFVRIPSLTGEEGEAQYFLAGKLRALGAAVDLQNLTSRRMFAAFPHIAQYPTHWQHDLILPYEDLPTYAALQASGLEDVLNYDDRPNVVGVLTGRAAAARSSSTATPTR